MLFRHYFSFILTRFAWKSNLINTCNRSPLGPLQRLGVNSGAPTLLILSICKPFSLLTTSFLLTDTMITIKIPFIPGVMSQDGAAPAKGAPPTGRGPSFFQSRENLPSSAESLRTRRRAWSQKRRPGIKPLLASRFSLHGSCFPTRGSAVPGQAPTQEGSAPLAPSMAGPSFFVPFPG